MDELTQFCNIWRGHLEFTARNRVDDTGLPLLADNEYQAGLDMLTIGHPCCVKDVACARVVVLGLQLMRTHCHWSQRYIEEIKASRAKTA